MWIFLEKYLKEQKKKHEDQPKEMEIRTVGKDAQQHTVQLEGERLLQVQKLQ